MSELVDPFEGDETINEEIRERLRVWDAHELDDRPMEWLAVGTLPRAATAVLVGEEGIGKSLWWVAVAAHLTTGRAMPAIGLPPGESRNVLLILTEDLWGEVRAGLEAAGADLRHVKVLCTAADGSGVPTVPGDHQLVYEAALEHEAALIVVDAWLDVVPSGIRVADTQQARQALAPWSEICKRTGATALLLTHTNRLQTTSTRDRMGGTVALRQKARLTLVAATKDDERGQTLYVGPDKANTTALVNAIRYDLEVSQAREATATDPGTVARLARPVDAASTIQQLVKMWAAQATEEARPPSAADRVKSFLVEYLSEHGTVNEGFIETAASAAKSAARAAGHNPERIAGVVTDLGGVARPAGPGAPWVYRVPVSAVSADSAVSVNKGIPTETATDTAPAQSPLPVSAPDPVITETAKTAKTAETGQCPGCGNPIKATLSKCVDCALGGGGHQ
ncbi:AAA family ATPase [Ruania alkalisoli]|uniref:AAA family ATPase n=1 Tax=Ruania alkalisoli TaxID=2779775 RepID=A0A7M1SPL9_9MICO|nr:AAA family ATPase [Ruania alkalisoli]QOR69137.1 AAA family ATPase [Ruania alkalisoli]